jgi:hypothetical protein
MFVKTYFNYYINKSFVTLSYTGCLINISTNNFSLIYLF